MQGFTQLESDVLDAICEAERDTLPQLKAIISTAVVVERTNTGHGFYTNFRSEAEDADEGWPKPIYGPEAHMIGMGKGGQMGFLLWFSTEASWSLEGYQNGDINGETVDLKSWDLADLRADHLEWENQVY